MSVPLSSLNLDDVLLMKYANQLKRKKTSVPLPDRRLLERLAKLPADQANAIADKIESSRQNVVDRERAKLEAKLLLYDATKTAKEIGSAGGYQELKAGDVPDDVLADMLRSVGLEPGPSRVNNLRALNNILAGRFQRDFWHTGAHEKDGSMDKAVIRKALADRGYTNNDKIERVYNRYQRLILRGEEPYPSDISVENLTQESLANLLRAKANVRNWRQTALGAQIAKVDGLRRKLVHPYANPGIDLSSRLDAQSVAWVKRFGVSGEQLDPSTWPYKSNAFERMINGVTNENDLQIASQWITNQFIATYESTLASNPGNREVATDQALTGLGTVMERMSQKKTGFEQLSVVYKTKDPEAIYARLIQGTPPIARLILGFAIAEDFSTLGNYFPGNTPEIAAKKKSIIALGVRNWNQAQQAQVLNVLDQMITS